MKSDYKNAKHYVGIIVPACTFMAALF